MVARNSLIQSDTEKNVGRGGLRVLLVEDDAATATATARVLRTYGHEVQVVLDGPSALEAAQANLFDVVLLDIGLPGMDGYEVVLHLRQVKHEKRPVVIALTGYGQKEERLRSYQAGMDLHLTKPVNIEQLERFLERYQQVTTPGSE